MKKLYASLCLLVFVGTCGTGNIGCSGTQVKTGADTVAKAAATAPGLAKQFDVVYEYLVAQKLIPNHTEAATKALAAMDAVAPLVQRGAEALTGDNFNWAQFVLQSALVVAQTLGYVLPLIA